MYNVFAYAISGYIDRNGLPHTPRIVVSPDLHEMLPRATAQLTELMDDVTGEENDEVHVAAMLSTHFHEMLPMTPLDVFEEIDEDETYENAPKFYVAVGVDEDDLEDLMIGIVGDPEQDDEDDYLEPEDEDNEEL